jgi:protein-S-isoprenylcysteine O-methyltransferase Ste14
MPHVPRAYAVAVQRLRVPSGFLLLAAYLWLARPSLATMAAGLPVAALGLCLRAWAAGHLRKNEALVTSGPYAWMRNPLYGGTLLAALGFVIAAGQPWLALLFAAAFALIYGPVMSNEEEHLRKLFPAFEDYARQVPLLWPRPPIQTGPGRFEWSLYWKNQEYKAALAFAAAAAFLYWKST